jgi:hypothetical protein
MKTYAEIRSIYLTRYPHLAWCGSNKNFAENALRLTAPKGIIPMDTWTLAKIANQ